MLFSRYFISWLNQSLNVWDHSLSLLLYYFLKITQNVAVINKSIEETVFKEIKHKSQQAPTWKNSNQHHHAGVCFLANPSACLIFCRCRQFSFSNLAIRSKWRHPSWIHQWFLDLSRSVCFIGIYFISLCIKMGKT